MHRRMILFDWTMVVAMVLGVVGLLAKGPIHQWLQGAARGTVSGIDRHDIAKWGMLVASCAFVAVATHSLARERSLLALLLCLGLVLCWVGDVTGFQGQFIPSVAAFLCAHLLFAAGFATAGLHWQRLAFGAAAVAISSVLLALWILPHVPSGQKVMIVGYIVVISTMVVTACGTTHPNRWLLALAACLFYVSDIGVAYGKFIPNSTHSIFYCYPLYYPACMLLAVGARLRAA